MNPSKIVEIQKIIYDSLRRKALSYEASPSRELKLYRKEQRGISSRKFSIIEFDQLKMALENSQFIYLGDFHTFDQSSKNILRLLRHTFSFDQTVKLGMEMIHSSQQYTLNAFLKGFITELEFLELINYQDSWRFPWNHYREIFQFAIQHNIEIIALNSLGTLSQRDRHAAKILAKQHCLDPDQKYLILFGELHILPQKLPALVSKYTQISSGHCIIHQNLDDLYWQIESDKHPEDLIVKFNEREFCLMTSTPWIKYESMIYWYENLCDDPDYDIHNYIVETGFKIFSGNTNDNFYNLCEEILKSLEAAVDRQSIEDFSLYDHTSMAEFIIQCEKIKGGSSQGLYAKLITINESFRMIEKPYYYCPNYSINRLAKLAGIHVFHLISKSKLMTRYSSQQFFIYKIFEHLYSYFFSKIINPQRKCNLYRDLEYSLINPKSHDLEKEVNFMSLQVINNNEFHFKHLKGSQKFKIFLTSKTIGYFLAEFLYQKIIKSEITTNKFLNFELDFTDAQTFLDIKELALDKTDYKASKKRIF